MAKRLIDAVYEFLGTKEEIEITEDLLKTQLAFYKLSMKQKLDTRKKAWL